MMVFMAIAGFALFVGAVLYEGFVLLHLWAWFVVPFGVMPVTLPWAIGLCVMIGAARGWPETSDNGKSPWLVLLKPYIASTQFLCVGYIVHNYM